MKKLLLLLTFAFTITLNAQDDKTVTLVVSGQGKTQDEARQKALRSAIEQAFGTFISSKTEILNDNLVKDEIVSVANGNIQKFEVLSEVKIPDGGYATTLKAIVSVSKLTSFCESKGVEVEFKGGLFAMNIKIQQLNEKNEILTIKKLCETLKYIADKSFDYTLSNKEPKAYDNEPDKWAIDLKVDISVNENMKLFKDYLINGLKGVAMTIDEQKTYKDLNKKVYKISIDDITLTFRNFPTIAILQDLCWYLYFAQANFIISDGINSYSAYDVQRVDPSAWNDKNLVDFKYDRTFVSNWQIIENLDQGIDHEGIMNTPFGDFSKRVSSSTYDLTKKAIISQYKWLQKLANAPPSDAPPQITLESHPEIAELRCYADSSTVYVSRRARLGNARHAEPKFENEIYLKIHPHPPLNTDFGFEFGKRGGLIVRDNSPASNAGLISEDAIVSINGNRAVKQFLYSHIGDSITLRVMRRDLIEPIEYKITKSNVSKYNYSVLLLRLSYSIAELEKITKFSINPVSLSEINNRNRTKITELKKY
jgi:hypothetical protein